MSVTVNRIRRGQGVLPTLSWPLTRSLDYGKEGLAMHASREVWRPVVGHEGAYEVSDLGHVRSLDRIITFPDGRSRTARGRLLKVGSVRGAHQFVNLGKGKSRYVHQLVAEAFLGPRPDGTEVCHNNGDPTDNRASNLRYDSHAGNYADMFEHGTHPQARKTHCPQGHEYNADNSSIRTRKSGAVNRICLICKRENTRKARANGATW